MKPKYSKLCLTCQWYINGLCCGCNVSDKVIKPSDCHIYKGLVKKWCNHNPDHTHLNVDGCFNLMITVINPVSSVHGTFFKKGSNSIIKAIENSYNLGMDWVKIASDHAGVEPKQMAKSLGANYDKLRSKYAQMENSEMSGAV